MSTDSVIPISRNSAAYTRHAGRVRTLSSSQNTVGIFFLRTIPRARRTCVRVKTSKHGGLQHWDASEVPATCSRFDLCSVCRTYSQGFAGPGASRNNALLSSHTHTHTHGGPTCVTIIIVILLIVVDFICDTS